MADKPLDENQIATPDAEKKPARRRTTKKTADGAATSRSRTKKAAEEPAVAAPAAIPTVMFKPPEPVAAAPARKKSAPEKADETAPPRKRAPRGGQKKAAAEPAADAAKPEPTEQPDAEGSDVDAGEGARPRRRRRRRRRAGEEGGAPAVAETEEDAEVTVHVREPRKESEIGAVGGSVRLEAKRRRRRDTRETRRRPQILTEAEFLARRESVERTLVVREYDDRTQVAVLEDGVLVEHYVQRATNASMVYNVYLGKVQNVLPSMEAAFIDIGRGRNAVLYAGEVNWDAAQFDGKPKRIEQALKPGQSVLVQVTKDPLGHKGARLTSQISVPGRFVVLVPDSTMTGISRRLPDTERARLKSILKKVLPEGAGVIVRTAAEGASEDELTRDVKRLQAQWEDIQKKVKTASAPALLYAEPDLVIRVIRDIFNEDFNKLIVQGDYQWDMVEAYVGHVAPDLRERLERWTSNDDVMTSYRVEEQLMKALERKVWLPSGGSLVFDRTEAMVVVDVNTGKFTGKGGTLEETVTKTNLEAAEEIVRQLRLRDLGGIIVIDFIDMLLESNRDLVVRRLTECLARDRTKHQVAEVSSLGLVQMTRKRVGQGLLEAFSEPCPECGGRGVKITFEAPRARTAPEAAPDASPAASEAPEPVADSDDEHALVVSGNLD